MILLRQQNQQEIEVQSSKTKGEFDMQGARVQFSNKEKSQNMWIYPCCFQLFSLDSISPSNQQVNNHLCVFSREETSNKRTLPFRLLNQQLATVDIKNTIDFSKFTNLTQNLSCSLCLMSYSTKKCADFVCCLNCKQQFCQKCSLQVHAKGKFMSHQLEPVVGIINPEASHNLQNVLTCKKHKQSLKFILKNQIGCETCFKQQSGKSPSSQMLNSDYELVGENIKFSEQYFNQIYHNQANKLTELKQNLSKLYKDLVQKLEEKYISNLALIERLQSNMKSHFNQNIGSLNQMSDEIRLISVFSKSLNNLAIDKLIKVRVTLIQENLLQTQSKLEQFIDQTAYNYKIGDKDKNQMIIDQLLKNITITKIKRHEEDGVHTNRSSIRQNLKTSRTDSRPSSNRLTNSKENRCFSSFKNNDNMSSCKQKSSFKDKDRNSIVKNYVPSETSKKTQDLTRSLQGVSRNSMGKSISKNPSLQPSAQTSTNHSTFFKEKQKNIQNVKQLEKAEYQDLNLNLRKLIVSKKTSELSKPKNTNLKSSEQNSQSTSLEKHNADVQSKSQAKRHLLTKQNQKSTINSGSFLKIFDQRNKSSNRKNYLVSSGQDLQNIDNMHKVYIQTSNMVTLSPQNSSQLKKTRINAEISGNNRGSSNNKYSEVYNYYHPYQSNSPLLKTNESNNQMTNGQSSKSRSGQFFQEKSSEIFDNLLAVSCERKQNSPISEFNSKTKDESDMEKSQISEFSCTLGNEGLNQNIQYLIKVHMTKSIGVLGKIYPQQSIQRRQKIKKFPNDEFIQQRNISSQVDQMSNTLTSNKQSAKLCQNIFKDSTNTTQRPNQERVILMNEKPAKKKPDFMDMRERMRKPNYLSTRLGSNMHGVGGANKITDTKK